MLELTSFGIRGYINLHTRAYLLCPATRQGNQLPREFVNRQSQCTLDHVSNDAPVKSCTVENRENILTIRPLRWHRSKRSRQLLMRRSWDWKFSPTPNEKWSQRTWQRQDHHMMKREHDATRKDVWENITSSPLGTTTPLSRINSNQFWVYVGMEITSSRIRQFGHGRYLPSVQRDIFECIQLLLSQNHSTTMINWKFLSLDISNLFEGAKDKFY